MAEHVSAMLRDNGIRARTRDVKHASTRVARHEASSSYGQKPGWSPDGTGAL